MKRRPFYGSYLAAKDNNDERRFKSTTAKYIQTVVTGKGSDELTIYGAPGVLPD